MTTAVSQPPVSPTVPRTLGTPTHKPQGSMASNKYDRSSRASDEDAKTSVKVAIRIRPPLKPSDPGFELIPQRFQRITVQNTSSSSLAVDSPQGRKLFIFDRVFGGEVEQEGIFEYINPGVDAFLQGYNVSIMAYGQSGAGKSFTMGTSGASEQDQRQLMGIIPRAAESLFAKLSGSLPVQPRGSSSLKAPQRYSGATNGRTTPTDRDWQLKATYLEIYNEQLRDLLIPADTAPDMRPVPAIREDKGKILLTNLTQVDINSTEDLMGALNHGSAIRQTDATAINARSSRSHAIFSLNLVQKRARTPDSANGRRPSNSIDSLTDSVVVTDSKLHFVDLAGSERLKNTGASGDRAREGIAINAGLASLGKVISQLSSRNPGAHVSYRDSKLTRILQDSLGGNAITYLVACVTPAEFHLSETLNTVQYAQRARAIQSKPQIQHVNDEGEKSAVIDRLRAEIAFLRDQIKIAQNSSANGPVERSEEREADLQEQLLGVQESYSALSKRHAKLISQISKAGNEAGHADAAGATPAERIERANSMNKVIDQVVSEYEETIATLQTQMRSQKVAMDSSDNRVMEQESKIAYVEKVNTQLHARAQKFMDRESGLESYVRDLEARLDGRLSTDDRNAEVVAELRKQVNKMRDAEVTSEDYIASLEERLAEAEQDMELMNREINRLENVVERQRSVGRLDSLMMELNNIQKKGEAAAATELLASTTNGHPSTGIATPMTDPEELHDLASKTTLPESHDGGSVSNFSDGARPNLSIDADQPQADQPPAHSPSQMQFVEEKLDSVNQELVALRVEHESTVTEYDILAEKYQETLRALAALQRSVDLDASPESPELKRESGQVTSARTLSSDYSTVDDDDQQTEVAGADAHVRSTPATSISSAAFRPLSDISETGVANRSSGQVVAKEIDQLKAIGVQKDGHIEQLSTELEKMKAEHDKVLETVSNLKNEVQRAKAGSPASPTNFVRRKSGHNALGTDRTNRAFVSLSNIAADHLEDRPDARENFQIQIAALSNEMASRSERIEALEGEVANAKKEMEAKMQIISGLARERSSMIAASPIDVSVVTSMKDQLIQNENHIKALNNQLATREKELNKEISQLKVALSAPEGQTAGADGEKSLGDAATNIEAGIEKERNEEMIRLREEIESLGTSEKQLVKTINELESTLSSVDRLRMEKTLESESKSRALHEAEEALEAERQKLTEEMIQQRSTIETHASRYDALQQAYESLQKELNEHSGIRESSIAQLESHRSKIDELELHLSSQYDAIEEYKETIDDMVKNHTREIEEMHSIIAQHDMEIAKDIPEGEEGNYELRTRLAAAEAARTRAESTLEDIQNKVETLNSLERQLKHENDQLREREQRSSRLVQELEGQLTQSYDDSQQSSNRLSAFRRTSQHEVAEARAAAVKAQEHVVELQTRLQLLERAATPSFSEMPERANSMTSRKSIAMSSLPSPPPAIPLPPLPANAPASPMVSSFSGTDGRPKSPPTSMIAKRDSATQATIQEQEARIRTVEKHLNAEKQLTATLEEALTDLEAQGDKVKKEAEDWRKKYVELEDQLKKLKDERSARARDSQQQLDDERMRRLQADEARLRLEEKMAVINNKKKNKKNPLNCF